MSLFSTSQSNVWLDSLSAGFLPKWLLFISLVSTANSIQSYISLAGTQEVYAGTSPSSSSSSSSSTLKSKSKSAASTSPVTPLSARTFGTWTLISSIVRLQAALAIHDAIAYRMAFATFAIAGAHFGLEWFVFGTARWGRGLAGPVIVSTVSMAWMLWGWEGYVA